MGEVSEADRRELYDLALRYARAVDRRDYAAFEEIMTSDGIIAIHHGDPERVEPASLMQGHEQILEGMPGIERYAKTMHIVANQLVEIDSGGERGSGETYCVAHHLYDKNDVTFDLTLYIRYQDRFARIDGRWFFSERRLWVDFTTDRPLETG